MKLQELLLVSGYFVFYLTSALGYGTMLCQQITKKLSLTYLGAYLMIGLGVIANLSLVVGLLGVFTKTSLGVILGFGVVMLFWTPKSFRQEISKSYYRLLIVSKSDIVALAFMIFGLVIAFTLYLSAMQPPHASDELHYHFPQARMISETAKINWSLDGHYFYGNIPKMVDVLFGVGLRMQGYQSAHLFNYLFLLGFVTLVFAVVAKRYGFRSGVFASLLLLLFEDYTWNASVGFVDSATSGLEVGAWIMLVLWIIEKRRELLSMAGLLLGLALGAKYSPLPTALVMSMIVIYKCYQEQTVKYLYSFSIPAIVMGGYWYLKNWILFGNPFYPMYFGHKGVPEESYRGLMDAIWQWEDKTWAVFWQKLTRWKTYSDISSYASIFLAPVGVFYAKTDQFLFALSAYFLFYLPYWFLLATHQTRFLLSGLLMANIVLGILLAKLPRWVVKVGIVSLVMLALIVKPYPDRNLLGHYLYMKLQTVGRQYALGNISEHEYLRREFGCLYSTVSYLNDQVKGAHVIDNWNLYFAPSVSYFSQNKFGQVKDLTKLRETESRYYFVRERTKQQVLHDTTDYSEKNKANYLAVENEVIKKAQIVFEEDDCKLYAIPKTD